eukprot:Polyplicarium_translucidae@DN3020_c0_g1_i2.p1
MSRVGNRGRGIEKKLHKCSGALRVHYDERIKAGVAFGSLRCAVHELHSHVAAMTRVCTCPIQTHIATMGKRKKKDRVPIENRKKRRLLKTFELGKSFGNPHIRATWANTPGSIDKKFAALKLSDFTEGIAEAPVKSVRRLSERHGRIVKQLVEKHGEDVTAMSRDLKINVWQWTPAQCTRRIATLQSMGHFADHL